MGEKLLFLTVASQGWLHQTPLAVVHVLLPPPAPSDRNSIGGSLMTCKCQTNYIPETQGRREWMFSLHPLPQIDGRLCSGKQLLICKCTKARLKILEILPFTQQTSTQKRKKFSALRGIFAFCISS